MSALQVTPQLNNSVQGLKVCSALVPNDIRNKIFRHLPK
jgi:hypothetical protein